MGYLQKLSIVQRHVATLAGAAFAIGVTLPPMPAMADPAITYFTWAGYDLPEFHTAYGEKYDGEPKYAYFPDSEEAFQKLQQGFSVDVAHPCLPHVKRWKDNSLLRPIDTSQIANWGSLAESLRENPSVHFDGSYWMVPWEWGASSLIYRTDQIKTDVTSYQILLDPQYKGRVSIPDNIDEMSMLAILLAGIKDPYTLDDADYAAISEKMKALVAQSRFIWSDPTTVNQAMASGEISMFWGWPNTWVGLEKAGVPAAYVSDPKEGIVSWACGFVLTKDSAERDEEIYDFINASLEPKSGATLMEKYGYGHSNLKSFEGADSATMAKLGLAGDVGQILSKGNMLQARSDDQRKKLIQLWEEAKLQAGN